MEGATLCHEQKTLLLFFLLQLLFLCEERLSCGDHIRLAVVSVSSQDRCGHRSYLAFCVCKGSWKADGPWRVMSLELIYGNKMLYVCKCGGFCFITGSILYNFCFLTCQVFSHQMLYLKGYRY